MNGRFGASMDIRFEQSFEAFVEFLTERGLSHVELRQGYLDTHPNPPSPARVRKVAADHGLTVSYHAPHRDCNLANPNETVRNGSVAAVKESLSAAAAADAHAVVVHGGTLRPYYPERVRAASRDAAVRSLRECARFAADVGVPLCVENQREKPGKHRLTAYPDRFSSLLEDVAKAAPRPAVTLDVGHAKATGVDVSAFLDALGDDVVVAHLHDNDGTEDAHDPLPGYREVADRIDAEYNVLEMKSLRDIERCLSPQ
ncbi:sugar phosphate isomerase/epimerase family protein [Haloferax sp. S1W]|uniref:sugar phosphate isomerase/epimerase family protein n=1 Tax=Haloferax sp. S1W TaxID=3377110 RepID=UPI0037CC2F25